MAKRASKSSGGGGEETSRVVAKLEIDTSQAEQAPKVMAGVGASIKGQLEGLSKTTREVQAELKLATVEAQKAIVVARGEQKRMTAEMEAGLSERKALARRASSESLALTHTTNAIALEEERRASTQLRLEKQGSIKKSLQESAQAHNTQLQQSKQAHQVTLQTDKQAHETKLLQTKQSHQAIIQADRQAHQTGLQQSKQAHETGLQQMKQNHQTTIQVTKQTHQTQSQLSQQAHQVNLQQTKNAGAQQLQLMKNVGKQQVAVLRANTQVQLAQINQQTQAQAQQARVNLFQMRQQAKAGPGGLIGMMGNVGGAIYTIKTVIHGAQEVVRLAADMERLATSYERQSIAARQLAGSTTQLDALMKAYEEATGGAVDKVTALADVTRLQAIGFAENAEELEEFVRAARGISIAMGKDMADITQEVALTIANQSTRRLDQIGLGVGEVTERIDKLRSANSKLTREQAFADAVLGLATEKYGTLTERAEAQATGVEKLTVAWNNLGLALSQVLAGPVNAMAEGITVAVDAAIDKLNELDKELKENPRGVVQGGLQPTAFRSTYSIADAEKIRADAEFERHYLLQAQQYNLSKGGTGVENFEARLAALNATIAQATNTIVALNAAILNARDSYGASPREGRDYRPSAPETFTNEQWKVLMEAEQDRADMEENFAKERNAAVAEYEEQRTNTIANYEKQIARSAEDFARNRQRAEEDHQKAMADVVEEGQKRQQEMAEDLAKTIARATRDSNNRIAELQEDYERRVRDIREDSADKIKDLEEELAEDELDLREDHGESMAEIEKEYGEEREKAAKEYGESVLSAAADLDARAVWEAQRRYRKELQEAEEAHKEKVTDEQKALAKSLQELRENYDKRLTEERENEQERIDQAEEMHEEQMEDEKKALAQRIEDANTAYQEQLADAKEADAQRLTDMGEHFLERQRRENEDYMTRLGRMKTDHDDQLTELGRQHDLRMTQIDEQQIEEREAFSEAYTERLADAEIFNTAWMLEQARRDEEQIKAFQAKYEIMDKILGIDAERTPWTLSPIIGGYEERLRGLRAETVFKLDKAQTQEEIDHLTDLITWIDEQLGRVGASAAGVITPEPPKQQEDIAGTSALGGQQPAVGTVNVESGAIVINAAAGQSVQSLGDEFETRLLSTLRKVAAI